MSSSKSQAPNPIITASAVVIAASAFLLAFSRSYVSQRKAAEKAEAEGWRKHFERTKEGKCEPVYARIAQQLMAENQGRKITALDIGTGAGAVAIALALLGLEVTAEDKYAFAEGFVKAQAEKAGVAKSLHFRARDISKLEDKNPKEQFDYITARAVFPWVKSLSTQALIQANVTEKLKPTGRAVMEFWGPKHPWRERGVCQTEAEVRQLFQKEGLEIEEIVRAEEAQLAAGGTSQWDEMTVVARKT